MPSTLFSSLLAASKTAHRERQHEVAYHALTAAMHAAVDAGDADRLQQVAQIARTQLEELDAQEPKHRLATVAAEVRGHPGVYRMLIRDIDAHVRLLSHRTS